MHAGGCPPVAELRTLLLVGLRPMLRYHGLLQQGTFEGILSVNSLQKYHSVFPSLFDEASVDIVLGVGRGNKNLSSLLQPSSSMMV